MSAKRVCSKSVDDFNNSKVKGKKNRIDCVIKTNANDENEEESPFSRCEEEHYIIVELDGVLRAKIIIRGVDDFN